MSKLTTGPIQHLVLTVSDLQRSRTFYTEVLHFNVVAELPQANRVIMSNGTLILGIGLPPDPTQALADDRFSEHRLGLDHLSIAVENRAEMEKALALFDQHQVPHGEIKDLSPNGFERLVLAFRDPDNIQLELTTAISA